MLYVDDRVVDDFERVHDVCLVWSSEVQGISSVHDDSRELGDRLCRILFSSAGQSDRPWADHCGAAQDDAGGHYAGRLLDLLRCVPEGSAEVELCRGICADRGGGIHYFQRVVMFGSCHNRFT